MRCVLYLARLFSGRWHFFGSIANSAVLVLLVADWVVLWCGFRVFSWVGVVAKKRANSGYSLLSGRRF